MISGHHLLSAVIGAVAGTVTGAVIAVFAPNHSSAFYIAFALGGLVMARLGVLTVNTDTTVVIKPWPLATGFLCGITVIALIGNAYMLPPPSEISAPSNTAPTLLPFAP